MKLYANPTITDFRQDVNGDIKMLKIGVDKEDAYANIIGQAEGADLDNNKTATINVSTYTEPVEVLPTSGKDGMKKATITLSNIPSGATVIADLLDYPEWFNNDGRADSVPPATTKCYFNYLGDYFGYAVADGTKTVGELAQETISEITTDAIAFVVTTILDDGVVLAYSG